MKIKIVSNSMYDDLYQYSCQFYESLPYEKIKVSGRNMLYNFNFINYVITHPIEFNFDWMIYIDEDCFITDINALLSLLKNQVENNIDCSGMPDGGVISHRFHNPIAINPFFMILNLTSIREKYDFNKVMTMRYDVDLDKYIPQHLIKKDMPYELKFERTIAKGYLPYGVIYDNFEPCYKFYFWLLRNNYNILYLNGYDYSGDDVTTVLQNHEGIDFAYHTWFARNWGEWNGQTSHKNRILNIINHCKKIKKI